MTSPTAEATTTARADSLRGLEREVGVLIRRVRRTIGERAHAVHPELPPASYLVLAWLAEEGPVRASALACGLALDKGALSRQLSHLGELGLVERSPDPDDGRAHLVSASPEAVRRLAEVAADRRLWLEQRLTDFSDADLSTLVDLVGRYNQVLDETP